MIHVLTRLAPVQFLCEAYRHRAMIRALAVRDIQARYIGTFGGLLWAFVRPVTLVAIYYFVFVIGFRAVLIALALKLILIDGLGALLG